MNYACRDDYGAMASDTSAWAGIHYFSSREPEEKGPLTWPEGNGWIAKQLLLSGFPAAAVKTILQQGSPGFPRRHAAPEDYLHRTLTRARAAIATPFPARPNPRPSP